MSNVPLSENIAQADLLLREAAKDLATAQSGHDMWRVEMSIAMAQAHATLAQAKRWGKPA